jgi:hypothetical protein
VASGNLVNPLYVSPAGPITPLDILYGYREYLANGNLYMAHKCGFTHETLANNLLAAGFQSLIGGNRPTSFDIWIMAYKNQQTQTFMQEEARLYLPV